jgi:dihydrodipicolinate synthase/N-acetylneuraminate lyase
MPKVAVDIDSLARAGDFPAADERQRVYAALLELAALPLAGGSPVTVAFGSFKAATARVLGLEPPVTLPPLVAPDDAFLQAVAEILDPLAAAATEVVRGG